MMWWERGWVWGCVYTFLKTSLVFFIFYFTPGNSRQDKAPSLEILQTFVRSLGNSKTENQDPWKFHIIFSWSPLGIPLFLIKPWKFHMLFFWYSYKFHVLNPPFVFFLEYPNVALATTEQAIKGSAHEKLYQELGLEYLYRRRWEKRLCLLYKFFFNWSSILYLWSTSTIENFWSTC